MARSVTTYLGQLSSCTISEKANDPVLRKVSDRRADRQTDRPTNRQTDRQTNRQADRQTDIQTEKEKDRQHTDRQAHKPWIRHKCDESHFKDPRPS